MLQLGPLARLGPGTMVAPRCAENRGTTSLAVLQPASDHRLRMSVTLSFGGISSNCKESTLISGMTAAAEVG